MPGAGVWLGALVRATLDCAPATPPPAAALTPGIPAPAGWPAVLLVAGEAIWGP